VIISHEQYFRGKFDKENQECFLSEPFGGNGKVRWMLESKKFQRFSSDPSEAKKRSGMLDLKPAGGFI